MSFLQQAYLLEKYGMRLGVPELAEVLGDEEKTIYNKVSKGTLGIPTYIDGKKRYADVRDVAAYFDDKRAAA